MVQLKVASLILRHGGLFSFNSNMVQLKALAAGIGLYMLLSFNSNMVQLKVVIFKNTTA